MKTKTLLEDVKIDTQEHVYQKSPPSTIYTTPATENKLCLDGRKLKRKRCQKKKRQNKPSVIRLSEIPPSPQLSLKLPNIKRTRFPKSYFRIEGASGFPSDPPLYYLQELNNVERSPF